MFDASTLVSAALKANSVPERAFLRAQEADVFALSASTFREISDVLARPRFALRIPTNGEPSFSTCCAERLSGSTQL